jgi:hypothetical protein
VVERYEHYENEGEGVVVMPDRALMVIWHGDRVTIVTSHMNDAVVQFLRDVNAHAITISSPGECRGS